MQAVLSLLGHDTVVMMGRTPTSSKQLSEEETKWNRRLFPPSKFLAVPPHRQHNVQTMSSTNPDGPSLVLNVGSSSIKFKIYSSASTPFLRGSVSPVGGDGTTRPKMSIALSHGEVSAERILPAALDYRALVNVILSELVALPVVRDVVGEHWSRLELVVHRIVHGGEATEGKVVTGETEEEVLEWCREVEQLAPLHNHLALQGEQEIRCSYRTNTERSGQGVSFHPPFRPFCPPLRHPLPSDDPKAHHDLPHLSKSLLLFWRTHPTLRIPRPVVRLSPQHHVEAA